MRKWKSAPTAPKKQSNFGVYKQVISTGAGMTLERVTLTGNTPEIVQEAADAAVSQAALLDCLALAHEFLDSLPAGWLSKTTGDVGALNDFYCKCRPIMPLLKNRKVEL